MLLDFLLSWSRLNLLSWLSKQQDKWVNSEISKEVVTYFEYGKPEKRY